MVKKVKKQSWLRLAAFITVGMSLSGLVYQNNAHFINRKILVDQNNLSAAQHDQKGRLVRKVKSWFESINKRLASIMHGIIKQLKKIKKKTDSHMKQMESKMKQIESKMKQIDSNIKHRYMDTLNLKVHGLGKK